MFAAAVGFFLALVLFELQVERYAGYRHHERDDQERAEADAPTDGDRQRHHGREDQQVLELELKAGAAEAANPFLDDLGVGVGFEVAVDFVDVDRPAVGGERLGGPALFGGQHFGVGRLDFQLVVVELVGAARVELVAIQVVGGHGRADGRRGRRSEVGV